MTKKRLIAIGLDCVPPELIFDQLKRELPKLNDLAEKGSFGRLKSTIPPITVPAWMSMLTGKDPGELGIYGFRNRSDYSYNGMIIANSRSIKVPAVWETIADKGGKSVLIGVPLTYPPPKINGWLLSCFLIPDASAKFSYPNSLKQEIIDECGDYRIDVANFRTSEKDTLLNQVYDLTKNRFQVAEYLLKTKDWDFFMMVDMGPDRLHHGFWKYCDPGHPKYEANSPYANVFREYYAFLDERIGSLLSLIDNDTAVLVVSDHGAKKMDGGICVNEWLIKQGYLHIRQYPNEPVSLAQVDIDWSKTIAWGEGGYYSRIFLNVAGREPEGVIPKSDYEKVRERLARELEAIEDENGNNIGTKVFKPEEVYRTVRGIAPDLIVYFGNLNWRSVGSIGLDKIHTFENDTGPDDANHAEDGIYIHYDPERPADGAKDLTIYDIAPIILEKFGCSI